MAANASISVLLGRKNSEKIHASEIINAFVSENWRLRDEGKIVYLPLNDDDNLEWQCNDISVEELIGIADEKEERGEIIGVLMLWGQTNIGIRLLIYSELALSFVLDVNRKIINGLYNENITDVSWYSERIIGLLKNKDYLVESFAFEEY